MIARAIAALVALTIAAALVAPPTSATTQAEATPDDPFGAVFAGPNENGDAVYVAVGTGKGKVGIWILTPASAPSGTTYVDLGTAKPKPKMTDDGDPYLKFVLKGYGFQIVDDTLDPFEAVVRIIKYKPWNDTLRLKWAPFLDTWITLERICGGSAPNGTTPTSGDDIIVGTPLGDTINGSGGNDIICGEGGDDDLRGGGGFDLIVGGAGDDVKLAGNGGVDAIFGGAGSDATVKGGGGHDVLFGGAAADGLSGGKGDDFLFGGSGGDSLKGGGGYDQLDGGRGLDSCNGEIVVSC